MGLLRELLTSSNGGLLAGTSTPADGGTADMHHGSHTVTAVADWQVHVAAAARRYHHTAFLSTAGGSSSSTAGPEPKTVMEFHPRIANRTRNLRTSFDVDKLGVELGPVDSHLVYQSPEVYTADISKYDKVLMKKKFVADFYGDMMPLPTLHPEIMFKKRIGQANFHLVDTVTGEVYWDANFDLFGLPGAAKMSLATSGLPYKSRWLEKRSTPVAEDPGTMPIMKKFWIPEDDAGPHLFDLKISTKDGWFNDQPDNEWGENEGFGNLYGHSAHIGVSVFRRPILEKLSVTDPRSKEEEVIETTETDISETAANNSPILHEDTMQRVLNNEEDLFEDELTHDDDRLYYGWMIESDAFAKEGPPTGAGKPVDYYYMWKPKVPPLVKPNWMDYMPLPTHKFKMGVSHGHAAGPDDEYRHDPVPVDDPEAEKKGEDDMPTEGPVTK